MGLKSSVDQPLKLQLRGFPKLCDVVVVLVRETGGERRGRLRRSKEQRRKQEIVIANNINTQIRDLGFLSNRVFFIIPFKQKKIISFV